MDVDDHVWNDTVAFVMAVGIPRGRLGRLIDNFLNRLNQKVVIRLDCRLKAIDNLTIAINEELCKVPFNWFLRIGVIDEPSIEWAAVSTPNRNLGKEGKGNLVSGGAKRLDLLV